MTKEQLETLLANLGYIRMYLQQADNKINPAAEARILELIAKSAKVLFRAAEKNNKRG